MGLSSRYEIVRSNHPSLKVTKKGTIQVFGSDSGKSVWTGTITGPNERENEIKRCKEILEYSCETLWGAIGYYNLALAGADQLVIAGNLYMAMEELWHHPDFGNQERLATTLQLNPPEGINKSLKEWWGEIHRARHVYDKEGNKLDPLSNEELDVYKRFVREAILAYVECLKENEK
jgi:hypothetical protein